MPTLETADGKPVDVTPVDAAAVNAKFNQVMSGDGPDPGALPKRAVRGPATDDGAKPRTARAPKAEKSRTTKAPAAALSRDKRVEGLQGIGQVVAGIFALGGKATGSTALLADSLTIVENAEPAAEAVADMCDVDAKFAATIDKICSAGPWSALITVGVAVGTQMFRNHRPGMSIPGTVHPDELIARAMPAAA